MGRLKGSLNKNSTIKPSILPIEDRIRFIANLIIDRIIEDQKNGKTLLKQINSKTYG